VRGVETAIGRQARTPLAARPIDIDILLIDDRVADYGRFAVPQPYLASRAFNLIPLAEIAPDLIEPRSGKTIAALAAAVDSAGIVRKARAAHFAADRQEETPEVRLSLNRVGVSSVKHIIRLNVDGVERVYNADFTMVADLAPDKAGVHMSRFSELLEAATLEVLGRTERPARIEDLSEQIAREIVDSQSALRADVRLRAEFGLERWTPVSGKRTEETYTLIGIAHADRSGTRRVVGVEAEGMTACPCAQQMVREHAQRELMEAGFSSADADRALDALPVATHNQRGRGALYLGARTRPVTIFGPKTWSRSSSRRCRAKRTICSSGRTSSSSSTRRITTRSSSRTSCAGSSRARSTCTPTSPTRRSLGRAK
jgi:GTP cyclohydrolase-4